jgi:hypothetical protein
MKNVLVTRLMKKETTKLISICAILAMLVSSLAFLQLSSAQTQEPIFYQDYETNPPLHGKDSPESGATGYNFNATGCTTAITHSAALEGNYGINYTCDGTSLGQYAINEMVDVFPPEIYVGFLWKVGINLPSPNGCEYQFLTIGDLVAPPEGKDYINNKGMALRLINENGQVHWEIRGYTDSSNAIGYALSNTTAPVALDTCYYIVAHFKLSQVMFESGVCEFWVNGTKILFMNINNYGRNIPSSVLFGERAMQGNFKILHSLCYDNIIITTSYPEYTPKPLQTPTPSPIPTQTPIPTATPLPTVTPQPTTTPLPTATPLPSSSPTPTATSSPASTPNATPTNTLNPASTSTPDPTSAPTAKATPDTAQTPEPTNSPNQITRTHTQTLPQEIMYGIIVALIVAIIAAFVLMLRRRK